MRLSTLLLVVAALHGGSRPALAQEALERAESQLREPANAGPELLVTPPPAAQGSGYLGIKADDRGPGDGVRVVEVMAGSPADTGGLMPGDLITAVQSKAVHSVDDFAALLGRMSVGTNVTFDVLRDNERHSVEVVLGRKQLVSAVPQLRLGPMPPVATESVRALPEEGRPAPLGIRVEIVSNEIRRARNIPADSGVRVTKVTPNSAADKAGIPIDAIILEINGRAIGSPDEAAQALSRARVAEPISFALDEAGQLFERTVTPESAATGPTATPVSAPTTSGAHAARARPPRHRIPCRRRSAKRAPKSR